MSGANNDPEILLPGVGILKVTLSLFVDTVPVKCDGYEWQDCIETLKSLYLIFRYKRLPFTGEGTA